MELSPQFDVHANQIPVWKKLGYIYNQWDALHDGWSCRNRLHRVENLIRPIALNRKNALFGRHDEGDIAWGGIVSLIETCKFNGVEPCAYLKPHWPPSHEDDPQSCLDDLLP